MTAILRGQGQKEISVSYQLAGRIESMFILGEAGDMQTLQHKKYCEEMIKRERLIPIVSNGILSGFLSFYITNDDTKFIEAKPAEILEDEADGKICYVAQCIVSKHVINPVRIWNVFKKHIKDNFKSVEFIHWNRGKNGSMYSYIKNLKQKGETDGKAEN
jgi:hypothetical protein